MDKENYRQLKVQVTGLGQEVKHEGRDYMQFPVVMLVEGVHHGAIGDPVFYPASTIGRNVADWNRVPVPVSHPQDDNGQYILCNNADVAADWSVGFIDNARFDGSKLKANVWVDVERAENKHPGIMQAIEKDMEVSTGLLAVEDGEPGTWNNEDYASTIIEMIPDHLALLPNQVGACSRNDGCGIRANKNKDDGMKVNIIIDGNDIIKPMNVKILKDKIKGYASHIANEISHEGIANQIYSHVDSLDVRDNEGQYEKINFVLAIYDDYFVYAESTEGNKTLYKQNYEINEEEKLVLIDEKTEVREERKFVPVTNEQNEMEDTMSKTNEKPCCEKKVAELIANEASAFTDADKEFLEGLTEEQLDKIMDSVQVNEEADDEQESEEEDAPVVNQEDEMSVEDYLKKAPKKIGSVLRGAIDELNTKRGNLIKGIMENPANTLTEDQLKDMDTKVLESISSIAAKPEEQGLTVNENQPTNYFGANFGGGSSSKENDEEKQEPLVNTGLFSKKDK